MHRLPLCLLAIACAASAQQSAGTAYPILSPSVAHASIRHLAETRVGTIGFFNKRATSSARLQPECEGTGADYRCRFKFAWDFRDDSDPEEFAGVFLTLGRSAIGTVRPDGTAGPVLNLAKDGAFNFRDLLANASDSVSIESLRLVLRTESVFTLNLRAELEDQNGQKMFQRFQLVPGGPDNTATGDLRLRDFNGQIDLSAVKVVSLVVEERNIADRVINPPSAAFSIESLALLDEDGPRSEADAIRELDDKALVTRLARADFEALLRLVDAKTGASLDRTLFRDRIHWGATGWLLAALPPAAKLKWISPEEARQRGLKILRFADTEALWCDRTSGCLGNTLGLMYRFGGIDPAGLDGPLTGTRKLEFGNPGAVEASVTDTALFQFGAATFAAGFPDEAEIQARVQRLLNRTNWRAITDPRTGQFRMAWKPERDLTGPGFFAAQARPGFWASRDAQGAAPLTLDYWTDEGALAAILAAGSEAHPETAGPWYAMKRQPGAGPCASVTVTFPGAWFTYSFLTAAYLDPLLRQDRGAEWGVTPVDWRLNAAQVFEGLRSLSPPGELVLPDAVELPDATYRAQGRAPCAADSQAPFTGTRTPYSLQLAIGLGGETATRAIAEIRRILTAVPEVWDPMFGLLDSFHPDLSGFSTTQPMARRSGRWVQQQVWPLNKGAALLAQLNYLDDGVVWRTAGRHAVIRRGIEKIYAGPEQRRPRIADAGVALSTGTPVVRRIAPRSLFTVFGSAFAPAGTAVTVAAQVSRRLADTCVDVNGARVPVLAVTDGQVNAQAPAAMTPGEASIAVIRGCGTTIELASEAVRATAAARSPAFFSFLNRAGGGNPLAAIFADTGALAGDPGLGSELPGAEFRAPEPGDVVTLFGSGFGAVNPAVEDGRPPAGAASVTGQVRLTLGGVAVPPGDVLYAGASPCCAGVDQINFRIPTSAPAGDLRVILTIDGISSPEGPYLTVAAPR